MAPRPVHHQDPASLHPEQAYGPGPGQRREAAIEHHIAWELPSGGRLPHYPTQKLNHEKDGHDQLEAVEAGARDELGFHGCAILLVEYEVDGAEEEGECEQDGGDECEVEAGGDALFHPGAGDGGVGFTVALDKHHGWSWGGGRERDTPFHWRHKGAGCNSGSALVCSMCLIMITDMLLLLNNIVRIHISQQHLKTQRSNFLEVFMNQLSFS